MSASPTGSPAAVPVCTRMPTQSRRLHAIDVRAFVFRSHPDYAFDIGKTRRHASVLRNNEHRFGWMSIILHWVTAIAVFTLFPLGLYMAELTYMDPLYRTLPFIHRSIGVLLFIVVITRLLWRLLDPRPRPLATHARWERMLATITHALLYVLLIAVMISGYLMSTADGRPVSVFGWFEVPATITSIPGQEDVAGDLHFILAIMLVVLAGVHAIGALKHHLIDRDKTLWRMLRPDANASSSGPIRREP